MAEPAEEPVAAAEPVTVAEAPADAAAAEAVVAAEPAAPSAAADDGAPLAAEAEADAVFEGTEDEVAAATRIQAIQRGKEARKDMEDQQAAAVKIQAIQRGKQSRRGAAADDGPTEEEVAAAKAREHLPVSVDEALVQWDDAHYDFKYDLGKLAASRGADPAGTAGMLHHSFSFEVTRRNNTVVMGDASTAAQKVFTVAGNLVQMLDMETMEKTYLVGLSGAGVGAIIAHPSGEYFAVAEKGPNPLCIVYEYPSLVPYRVMRNGTEQGYSSVAFNEKGTKMATVGSYPDFLLTVWDWKAEHVVLKAKAFSQDIFNVEFSSAVEGELITSGTGHIRFWKMTETFTGLKLQGEIGKFGKVELSDISAFAMMPDGKVLSGSEVGEMLLWDGNFVKCVVARADGSQCHVGDIADMYIDLEASEVITAGADGWIRVWDFDTLDIADIDDDNPKFLIEPLREIQVGAGVSIMAMRRRSADWLIQDASGGVWSTPYDGSQSNQLLASHAGAIVGVVASPNAPIAVSAGADGTVRLLDYEAKTESHSTTFSSAATTLLWVPLSVDVTGSTVVVGFADGVVRLLAVTKESFVLLAAMKPSTEAINCLSYSPDGRSFVSGSVDGSLFFFAVESLQLQPVGFVAAESKVNGTTWSPDSTKLLACYETGEVLEYVCPAAVAEAFDTTSTYEIALEARPYAFRRIKTKEPKEEKPDDADNFGDELGEEGEEEVAEVVPEAPPEPALAIAYQGNSGNFNLTLGGIDSNAIYECSFDVKDYPVKVVEAHSAPCRVMGSSSVTAYMITGADNGEVQVRNSDATGKAFCLHLNEGAITAAVTTFDERFMLVAGADNNLFVVDLSAASLPSTAATPTVQAIEFPTASVPAVPVMDVADSAYSIQQDKLEAEKDSAIQKAEAKKNHVRQYLAQLRQEFMRIKAANDQIPITERLPVEAFDIDPELLQLLQTERDDKLAAARAEMQYEKEESEIQLAKLKRVFLDPLATEHVRMVGIRNQLEVCSLPAPILPEGLARRVQAVDELLAREEQETDSGQPAEEAAEADIGDGGTVSRAQTAADAFVVNKAEARKLARAERQKAMAALVAEKPGDSYEDPQHIAAIALAERTVGDFKLKAQDGYVVPDDQKVNTEKKRREMVLLEASVNRMRSGFNERFFALRDLKCRVMEDVKKDSSRLADIVVEITRLGGEDMQGLIEFLAAAAVLSDAEFPERREEFTDADLDAFIAQRLAGSAAAAASQAATGSEALSDDEDEDDELSEDEELDHLDDPRPIPSSEVSELEAAEAAAQLATMAFDHDEVVNRINATVTAFDKSLADLRAERFRLTADLKATDLKRLLLFKELALLKDCAKKEQVLIDKKSKQLDRRADLIRKIGECQTSLTAQSAEVEELLAKDRELLGQFEALVKPSDVNKFSDVLLKMFKRKIKRVKQKDLEGDDDEESEEDFSDFGSDSDEDEDDEEDVCPPDCPPELFEKVCALRERRLDQEEIQTELLKTITQMKKDNESLVKKEGTLNGNLLTVEAEIQAFETEKQQALNELETVVVLSLHQVQNLDEQQRMPRTLDGQLVFTNSELKRLRARIGGLQDEKVELRVQQRQLRKQHRQLKKDIKDSHKDIEALEKRFLDVQILKFGQEVDIDQLEKMSVNKSADLLREQHEKLELKLRKELRQLDRQLKAANAKLVNCTRENTERLQRLADLTEEQHKLEMSLNQAQSQAASADYSRGAGMDEAEKERLIQLVGLQGEEITALKAEINLLRLKGGHVYTGAAGAN